MRTVTLAILTCRWLRSPLGGSPSGGDARQAAVRKGEQKKGASGLDIPRFPAGRRSWGVTVFDTGMARASDFDLDQDTQERLFCKGREAALDGALGQPAWDWAAYRRTYRSSQSPVMRAAMQARDTLRSLRHRLHRRDQNGHRTPTGQAGPLKPSPTPL